MYAIIKFFNLPNILIIFKKKDFRKILPKFRKIENNCKKYTIKKIKISLKSTPRPSAVSAYPTTGMKALNGPEGKFAHLNSGPPRNEFRA